MWTDAEGLNFTKRLALLAEVLAEPMSPVRIAGYRAALEDLPADDISGALNQAAKECKFFPKPAELREFAGAISYRRELEEREAALALMRRHEEQALEARIEETKALPAHVETEEEIEARRVRCREAERAFFTAVRQMLRPHIMPGCEQNPERTIKQITEWKRERQAAQRPAEGQR